MTTKKIADTQELATTESAAIVTMEDVQRVVSKSGAINTLNLDTFEGQVQTLNALNNAVSLKEAKDTVLDICDCITMPGVRKGRNGMPDTECTNVYLIDTSGTVWFSQSDGIARSVQQIATIRPDFGKAREEGCLHLHVMEKELPNGNTIKSLVIDI